MTGNSLNTGQALKYAEFESGGKPPHSKEVSGVPVLHNVVH
jgi:hypothetical protein